MHRSPHVSTVALAAFWILVSAACAPTSRDLPASSSGGPSHSGVDAVFADLDRDGPGAAVGVLLGGEVVHRAGYGIAHLDHGVPITPETVFDIASISKQFGAMSALLLEAEGKLDLDEDVRAYVPELPDFGVRITPRHLIHHTSGIRDWVHVMDLSGVEPSDVISFEKILRMLFEQQAVNFAPGARIRVLQHGLQPARQGDRGGVGDDVPRVHAAADLRASGNGPARTSRTTISRLSRDGRNRIRRTGTGDSRASPTS